MSRISFKAYGVPKEHMYLFRQWNLHRAQAKHRGEPHELDWPEYRDVWIDHIDRRGTSTGSVCMVRVDRTQPWSKDNVALRTKHVDFYPNPNGRPKKASKE